MALKTYQIFKGSKNSVKSKIKKTVLTLGKIGTAFQSKKKK